MLTIVLEDPDKDAREMLKPRNMAGCSPRIFWSLVREGGPNLRRGLESLFPPPLYSWAWLEERRRLHSEKARINLGKEEDPKRNLTRSRIGQRNVVFGKVLGRKNNVFSCRRHSLR